MKNKLNFILKLLKLEIEMKNKYLLMNKYVSVVGL
jgi:hypothetical protein